MNRLPLILIAVALVMLLAKSFFFVLDEREQALVLRFGKVQRVIQDDPGLKFRLPYPINEVVTYDDRILPLNTSDMEVTPSDDRRLIVDAFARWRIADPEQFYKSVRTTTVAEARLSNLLDSNLRNILGGVPSNDILSAERASLMLQIRDATRTEAAKDMGIEVVDVRIRRTDLPNENLQATYASMRAEREQEAADQRARGAEAAQKIRARADAEAVAMVSEAQQKADIVRGEADAERNRVFADAFEKDPEFFKFYRSMEAYRRALQGQNSTMILSPDSEFFEYFTPRTRNVPAE